EGRRPGSVFPHRTPGYRRRFLQQEGDATMAGTTPYQPGLLTKPLARRRLAAAGAVMGAGLTVAGCGGSVNKKSSPPTASGVATRAATVAGPSATAGSSPSIAASPSAAQPKRGGSWGYPFIVDVAHLDVQQNTATALSAWGPGVCYSRLLML